jgi:hypothetical protein
VKQVLVVALVVVVVLTGIPLVVGMPAADCAECELGVLAAGACVAALLTAAALLAFATGSQLRRRRCTFTSRLVAGRLERPPRLA